MSAIAAMTNDQFKRWQKRMGWSNSETAEELRLNIRQVYHYRSGTSVVPAMAARLCELLELLDDINAQASRKTRQ